MAALLSKNAVIIMCHLLGLKLSFIEYWGLISVFHLHLLYNALILIEDSVMIYTSSKINLLFILLKILSSNAFLTEECIRLIVLYKSVQRLD